MAACPPGQAGAAKNLNTRRFFIPLRSIQNDKHILLLVITL